MTYMNNPNTSSNLVKNRRLHAFSKVDIYPVTCKEQSNGRTDFEVLDGIIKGGAKIIQLRDKTSSKKELYFKALKFREITSKAKILLIINDHVDIAAAVDADGVHLGQDDFPIAEVRRLFPELIIGVSTHSFEQAKTAAEESASYINIGPIYPTKTKRTAIKFLGPKMIEEISSKIKIPFTVMGGINEGNLSEVLSNGAQKVAVVSAITLAEDLEGTVRKFRQRIMDHNPL